MTEINDLQEARHRFFDAASSTGGVCPCCDRWGKINAYHMNSGMAQCLMFLHRWARTQGLSAWCHLATQADRTVLTSNSTGKLKHWGMVAKGDMKGTYRITAVGTGFALGAISAPATVFVYNDEVHSISPERVYIRHALGKKFDYDEMMQAMP